MSQRKEGKGDIVLKRTTGWIHKKGGAVKGSALSAMKNWKKRYFILEDVGTVQKLYEMKYYDKPNGTLKGSVKLKGTEVYCDNTARGGNSKNKKFEFQILLANGSMLKLYCDDLTERDEWVETLNYVVMEMKVKPLSKAAKKQSVKNATFTEMVEILAYNPSNEDDMADFEAGRDIANACQAYGSGLFGAEAGQNAQFMIQAYSATGDMLDGGGLPFSIALMDDECLYHILSHDNDDGTYSAFYSISRPGKYKLQVKLNDIHDIAGSPFDVEILPSYTVAGVCTASGSCLNSIQADVKSAMDGLSNRKKRGGDPFEIGVMGPAQLHGLTDNNDGTYSCVVEAKQPSLVDYVTSASLSITVTLHGKHIEGSPFRPIIDTQHLPQSQNVSKKHTQRDVVLNKKKKSSEENSDNYSSQGPPVSRRIKSAASVAEKGTSVSDSYSSYNTPAKREEKVPRSQQELLSTLDTKNSTLSKLELARQRALGRSQNPALQVSDLGNNTSAYQTPSHMVDESPPPPPPPSDLHDLQSSKPSRRISTKPGGSSLNDRMSKLDMMTKKFGESSLNKQSVNGGKLSNQPHVQNKNSALSFKGGSSSTTHDDVMASFAAGMHQSAAPENLSNDGRRIWSVVDNALRSSNVMSIVAGNVAGMEKCFYLAADGDVAYLSPTDQGVGLYKIFEEFDVIPAYISKKELKSLFNLIVRAQTFHIGKQWRGPNGKDVISFISFLKLLVMVSLHCLAKTSAFNSLYPTTKAKLDVMLFNWGFADPLKIKAVSDRVGFQQ